MPSNTTYKPIRIADFEASKLNFFGQSIADTVLAGQTKNLDLVLTDDVLLTGGWVLSKGGVYGDTVSLIVFDSTGAFTGTPGTTLLQPINNWTVPADVNEVFQVPYPAKVYAGMGIRLVYNSTGPDPVQVAINLVLHKVLV